MSRIVRDSFLHFLYDNLSPGITVHPIRRDPDAVGKDTYEIDAVNVSFRNQDFETHTTTQQIIIDVIYSDELEAEDTVKAVWDLLSARFFTPLYDYTNPSHPVAQGTNIFWKPRAVKFKLIVNDFYIQFQCNLSVQYNLKTSYSIPP